MLELLDYLFHILHIGVMIINTTFWWSLKTLRWAQITQFLTLISWLGFGFFYGLGYCFLTDWHWQIKEQLGETNLPDSYIKLALDRNTGKDWDSDRISIVAVSVLLISLAGCLIQTWRQLSRSKKSVMR